MLDTLKRSTPRGAKRIVRNGLRLARGVLLRFADRPRYLCPWCGYDGKFLADRQPYGVRVDAVCPRCGALERHRLQRCVLDDVFGLAGASQASVLHFAPEAIVQDYLRARFTSYLAADIQPRDVGEVRADMRCLQFADASFDVVYASHVLEHIDDDGQALAEVRRVLRPGGIAILPVPVVAEATVEYPHPVPTEHFHVRACGKDYFARYAGHFARVDVKTSSDYPARHQLHVHEDRSGFPNAAGPYRPPMAGGRHEDYVPVCYA